MNILRSKTQQGIRIQTDETYLPVYWRTGEASGKLEKWHHNLRAKDLDSISEEDWVECSEHRSNELEGLFQIWRKINEGGNS